MVQKLEDIKNGGGSIKIGATGKISALMSRELQSGTPKSRKPAILEPNDASKLEEKPQTDEASTSNKNINGNLPKTKHNHARKASKNPFFHDGSPNPNKKRSYIVEVVDIKCGIPDKIIWANPIKDRLKKLTFSKLSETNGVN